MSGRADNPAIEDLVAEAAHFDRELARLDRPHAEDMARLGTSMEIPNINRETAAMSFHSINPPDARVVFLNNRVRFWKMFVAILQQRTLPKALMKKMEQASRFWGKEKLSPKAFRNPMVAYLMLVPEMRQQSKAIHEVLDLPVACVTRVEAGPFTIVNSGCYPEADVEKVAGILRTCAELMASHGLGAANYGDVVLSNRLLRPTIGAFYLGDSDELFIRYDEAMKAARDKKRAQDLEHTICHELGHRVEAKLLSNDGRRIVRALYEQLRLRRKFSLDVVRRGDVGGESFSVTDKRGLTAHGPWTAVGMAGANRVKIRPSRLTVESKVLSEAEKEQVVRMLGATVTYTIPVQRWFQEFLKQPPPKGAFVTAYAAKSPSENFAEMVALHVLGRLDKEQEAQLQPVLRTIVLPLVRVRHRDVRSLGHPLDSRDGVREHPLKRRRDVVALGVLRQAVDEVAIRVPQRRCLPVEKHLEQVEEVHPEDAVGVVLGVVRVLRVVVLERRPHLREGLLVLLGPVRQPLQDGGVLHERVDLGRTELRDVVRPRSLRELVDCFDDEGAHSQDVAHGLGVGGSLVRGQGHGVPHTMACARRKCRTMVRPCDSTISRRCCASTRLAPTSA